MGYFLSPLRGCNRPAQGETPNRAPIFSEKAFDALQFLYIILS
jgi:hypothetical protein